MLTDKKNKVWNNRMGFTLVMLRTRCSIGTSKEEMHRNEAGRTLGGPASGASAVGGGA